MSYAAVVKREWPVGSTPLVASSVTAERFWAKVRRGAADDCWPWRAYKSDEGYGIVRLPSSGKCVKAHRLAWMISSGTDPGIACVLHRCDNRACCNPVHLFTGSQGLNIQDMVRKGRHNSRARVLSVQDAILIRGDLLKAIRAVAKKRGVAIDIVASIAGGKTWRHLR